MTNKKITLPQDFIEQVKKTIKPHWGELGWVTYKRTYARWLPEKNRTENWDETVKRVVEGNINLDPRLKVAVPDPKVVTELQKEAKTLYKLIYGLAATPSGRNLWISGTDYQKRNGDALNNCWFIAIRPQKYGDSHVVPDDFSKDQEAVSMPYSFMFDELMKGGGVGFSVTKENVAKIPEVDYKVNLTIVIDKKSASYESSIKAGAKDLAEWKKAHEHDSYAFYRLPDTREGWILANAKAIDHHFAMTNPTGQTNVVLDITDIRPKNAVIHGFGGTASGPVPLIEMLFSINNVINNRLHGKLNSVDATDIGNFIAKAVVAGNVRRSAELSLGSADDNDFITMKQDQTQLYDHRWASNNSVATGDGFKDYSAIADAIAHNGEPGIVNLDLSRRFGRIIDGENFDADPEAEGTNPCGEITLDNGEPCNLFEVFPMISTQEGWDLKEVFTLGTRYAKRVTFSYYDWEVSRNAIYKNRRLGVSMSGIQDWFLNNFGHRVVRGWKKDVDPETGLERLLPDYDPEITKAVDSFYKACVKADEEYSKELGCKPSIKHTTVKPSGTVAKLAGVSEGMHFHYAGYLIQRIRFQDADPLLPALRACGYHVEKDVYSENTMVAEFPIKAAGTGSKEFASAGNVSIAEQVATQTFLQIYWADNAVSCTVTFQPEEAKQINSLLSQWRHVIKSTSMLPYVGAGFKQAPKEPIDQKTYEEKKAQITGSIQATFAKMNNNQDKKDLDIVGQQDCEGGACPVK